MAAFANIQSSYWIKASSLCRTTNVFVATETGNSKLAVSEASSGSLGVAAAHVTLQTQLISANVFVPESIESSRLNFSPLLVPDWGWISGPGRSSHIWSGRNWGVWAGTSAVLWEVLGPSAAWN